MHFFALFKIGHSLDPLRKQQHLHPLQQFLFVSHSVNPYLLWFMISSQIFSYWIHLSSTILTTPQSSGKLTGRCSERFPHHRMARHEWSVITQLDFPTQISVCRSCQSHFLLSSPVFFLFVLKNEKKKKKPVLMSFQSDCVLEEEKKSSFRLWSWGWSP